MEPVTEAKQLDLDVLILSMCKSQERSHINAIKSMVGYINSLRRNIKCRIALGDSYAAGFVKRQEETIAEYHKYIAKEAMKLRVVRAPSFFRKCQAMVLAIKKAGVKLVDLTHGYYNDKMVRLSWRMHSQGPAVWCSVAYDYHLKLCYYTKLNVRNTLLDLTLGS